MHNHGSDVVFTAIGVRQINQDIAGLLRLLLFAKYPRQV
jgi:hypothetical protein